MTGTTMKTLDDIWSWTDTKRTRCPTSIRFLEVTRISKIVGVFMRYACGIFDEHLPWMRKYALVPELRRAEIIDVFLGPAPLNTAIILGIVE
jgi:hypothetical protein